MGDMRVGRCTGYRGGFCQGFGGGDGEGGGKGRQDETGGAWDGGLRSYRFNHFLTSPDRGPGGRHVEGCGCIRGQDDMSGKCRGWKWVEGRGRVGENGGNDDANHA